MEYNVTGNAISTIETLNSGATVEKYFSAVKQLRFSNENGINAALGVDYTIKLICEAADLENLPNYLPAEATVELKVVSPSGQEVINQLQVVESEDIVLNLNELGWYRITANAEGYAVGETVVIVDA